MTTVRGRPGKSPFLPIWHPGELPKAPPRPAETEIPSPKLAEVPQKSFFALKKLKYDREKSPELCKKLNAGPKNASESLKSAKSTSIKFSQSNKSLLRNFGDFLRASGEFWPSSSGA